MITLTALDLHPVRKSEAVDLPLGGMRSLFEADPVPVMTRKGVPPTPDPLTRMHTEFGPEDLTWTEPADSLGSTQRQKTVRKADDDAPLADALGLNDQRRNAFLLRRLQGEAVKAAPKDTPEGKKTKPRAQAKPEVPPLSENWPRIVQHVNSLNAALSRMEATLERFLNRP